LSECIIILSVLTLKCISRNSVEWWYWRSYLIINCESW